MSDSELFKQSSGQATQRSDTFPNDPRSEVATEIKYVAHYPIISAAEARILHRYYSRQFVQARGARLQ